MEECLDFYAEFGLPLHIWPIEVRGRAKQCYAIVFYHEHLSNEHLCIGKHFI